jgi:hypothetical protein
LRKEIQVIKKEPSENIALKKYNNRYKNLLYGLLKRVEMTECTISELGNKK